MTKKEDQIIYAVHRSVLGRCGLADISGFVKNPNALRILDPVFTRWLRRGDAESDERFRQIIPYVVVTRHTSQNGEEVVAYTRTPEGGDARLVGKRSIGVGGHMERFDTNYREALWREVALEEIRFRNPADDTVYDLSELGLTVDHAHVGGFLHMSDTAVDRVHTGIVHTIKLPATFAHLEPISNEDAISDVSWTTLNGVRKDARFENWSMAIAARDSFDTLVPVLPVEPKTRTMADITFHGTYGIQMRPSKAALAAGVNYSVVSARRGAELVVEARKRFSETALQL